jgi:cobaltochelatase CobN
MQWGACDQGNKLSVKVKNMDRKLLRAAFVFSHPMLFNVWAKAQEILKEELIETIVVNQGAPVDWQTESGRIIEQADAVYFAGIRHFPNFDTLVSSCKKASYVLPAGIEASAALDVHDEQAANRIETYFKAGSPQDLANAVRFLLYKSGSIANLPPPPPQPLLCGIYHPESGDLFPSLCEYLNWQEQHDPAVWTKPFVAFCFPRSWILAEDMALVHSVLAPLKESGLLPVPVFCDEDIASQFGAREGHPLDKILSDCGKGLAAIWYLLAAHSSSADDSGNPFCKYDAPVFQIIRNYNQTVSEWQESTEGLSAMSICYSLIKPEMLGCIEPTLLACNQMIEQVALSGKTYQAVAVPQRIASLAARTAKWHALRTRPNAEKRLAIMLHNAPCKGVEATIATAAGLNAAQSAVSILNRLHDEGYLVKDIPADGRALLDLILEKKAISEFRWTNVEEIEAKGGVIARIYEQDYLRNFSKLSDSVRKRINEAWDPFPGGAMVFGRESGNPCLLITGIWFGNILVMVEPKRGCWGPKCDGEVCRILHDPDIPPPHHWLATYWYLQQNVDALIPLGADSPLEYLPGKRAALSDNCYPEISLGNLPVVYPYIFSAIGEGLMAKRRGRGVLIDHLTPPIARITEDNGCWAEMETLHAQYCAARDVKDTGRLTNIAQQLRGLMEKAALLEPEACQEKFELRLEQLPRKIEQLRKRFSEKRSHVLGTIPEEKAIQLYLNEARGNEGRPIDEHAMRDGLRKASEELDRLVAALSARFVEPGPGGHLSRGKIEVLPTGRNFYGTDLKAIPTMAAWKTGVQMGQMILRKYLDEEASFPQFIAITLWSSDVFRADGELISQGLWLAGCRPVWTSGGRVTGIELIPTNELTMKNSTGETIARPRVDIVIQMSGIVRDTLPNMYMMLDEAVEIAAAQDEPESVNFIRAHVEKRMRELQETMSDVDIPSLHRLARCRVFSSKPGSYGTGIGLAIDAAAWEDDKDLAEVYVNWTGFAYGKGMEGTPSLAGNATATFAEYSRLMGNIDIAYQKAIGPEYDAMSCGCYSSFQGGMAAVNRAVGSGQVKMYWGDSSSGIVPEVRSLGQEIDESLFAKLLNPDWIGEKKKDGYTGARSVSGMINTLFHWSASAHVVTDEQFDAVWRTYIDNEENRQWLQSENIYALEEITRRLLEAASRMMWNASEDKMEKLKHVMLIIEGDIEEKMGQVGGEFQGSAVDIKRRKEIEKWQYAFTLK